MTDQAILSRDAALCDLKRSLFTRILAALLWIIPVTLSCLFVLARIAGRVFDVGAEQASAIAAVIIPFGSLAGIGLTSVLSLIGFLPGTAKFKTAHRCPECLAPASFDRRNTKNGGVFGSWSCPRCGTTLQVNRIHLIGGLVCATTMLSYVNYNLGIERDLQGVVWFVVAGLAYRIGPILTSVTRRRDNAQLVN
jgi:hypothetical protein